MGMTRLKKRRLGGQSFPNGVLIKSKRNWALATDDGNIRFGSSSSWLDRRPILNIVFIRSIIAFFESVVFSFRIQRDISLDGDRVLLRPLILYLVTTIVLTLLIIDPDLPTPWLVHALLQITSFAIAFFLFSRALPKEIWSYHGAEHKTIHAYEQGVDLDNLDAIASCSRVHNRCGTNLVAFFATASLIRIPSGVQLISMASTIGYTLLYIGVSIELFRLVVKAPEFAFSRLLLAPGRLLQKMLTTREPSRDQLAIAAKATKTVLALDAMRVDDDKDSA